MPIVTLLLAVGVVLVAFSSMTTLGWILILVAVALYVLALLALGGIATLMWKIK